MERNLASHAPPRRRGGLPRMYVAVWVMLSSMALTYLAMLSIRPDLAKGLGEQIAALAGVEAQPTETMAGRAAGDERTQAEVSALRQGLDTLQRELMAIRTVIAAREDRDQAFAARLAAIEAQRVAEQSLPIATASVNRGPLETPAGAGDDGLRGRAVEGRIVDAPPPPPPSALPTRRPPPPRDAERVVFGAPQVKPPPAEPEGPRGIQIATGPSVDALRISWMLLAERHKEILRRYEPRFVPSPGGSGPAFRLIAGPIPSTGAANRVCGELRARRVTCGVSAFGGEPL